MRGIEEREAMDCQVSSSDFASPNTKSLRVAVVGAQWQSFLGIHAIFVPVMLRVNDARGLSVTS